MDAGPTDDPRKLAERRRELRIPAHLIATALGRSPSAITKYEAGERTPSRELLRRWAAVLDQLEGVLAGVA